MKELIIGGQVIEPGQQLDLEIPISYLYTQHDMTMPVRVIRGKQDGPVIFISAALHGDEINGLEIIARLLRLKEMQQLRGTLIAIPVVNVFGFLHNSRYLPDRRDLNRSFPGSEHGSMAARLAHTFLTEIAQYCDYGIDLHTAAIHRGNLPQIRVDLSNDGLEGLARAFGAPVILNTPVVEGSLRATLQAQGVPLLLYECGEALRFDEPSIQVGVRGIVSVLRKIGLLPTSTRLQRPQKTVLARSSHWVRATVGGVLRSRVKLGKKVEKGQQLGYIGDPFGENATPVLSSHSGIVIGINYIPLVDEGNALFHIATFEQDQWPDGISLDFVPPQQEEVLREEGPLDLTELNP